MNNADKNLFQLIEEHKKAAEMAAEHYLSCDQCQKYTYDLDAVKCDTGIKLDRKAEKIRLEFEDYKIDID